LQAHFDTGSGHRPRNEIDRQIADRDARSRRSLSGTARKRLETRIQFGTVEWFHEIIIAAAPQAFDAVADIAECGENEYGHALTALTELREIFEAVSVREHAIEDDDVKNMLEQRCFRAREITRPPGTVPRTFEIVTKVLRQRGVVFDNEEMHACLSCKFCGLNWLERRRPENSAVLDAPNAARKHISYGNRLIYSADLQPAVLSRHTMYRIAQKRINRLSVAGDQLLLQGGGKGLEKESLRISRDGSVATTPHPHAWGSPLTHPYVTTDYSEALTELVTPTFTEIDDVLNCLDDLHRFLYGTLSTNELMWAASMPCAVGDDQAIPIAQYGSSNIGQMKHIYRVGLDYRYGRRMQAIAGVHFNYSLPAAFWPEFQEEEEDAGPLREFVDEHYFGLIRNFHRLGWLIPFLFGNSPAVCKSFLAGRTTRFKSFDSGTHYLPYATSLRMSDIGYKNKNQSALAISYDNLTDYVDSLRAAIETPYPEYEAIGIRDGDRYVQLNTNTLQIENEYYSFVRPKRVTLPGEKPTAALHQRGVEYVEIRALDVNAFDPNGVNEKQLRFMEAFLIFCLLERSPPISEAEQRTIQYNELTVALRGREPGLALQVRGGAKALKTWAEEILDGVEAVCAALDAGRTTPLYADALEHQRRCLEDFEMLPSARILAAMRESDLPFAKYAFALSERHETYFRGRALDPGKAAEYARLAAESIEHQAEIEAGDDVDLETFLDEYFASA